MDLAAELRALGLDARDAGLDALREDRSGHRSDAPPAALVEAHSVSDVQAVLRFASGHRIPVVPRGAGTGLAGGAIGGAGEIVLSLLAMDRILELNVADQYAVVEPGILNGDLNRTLAADGLWFAPDPASRAISTVGGNIATNAGGLQCVKYGVTREAVLGLSVVLADGRLIQLGRRTLKGVTGYDLTALMVGSEGTLGVIVGATLRLRPLPEGAPATALVRFGSVREAAAAATALTGFGPTSLELIDARSLGYLSAHLGEDLGTGAQLLVQFDGADAARELDRALPAISGGVARVSYDAAEGERLFQIRRAFHPAISASAESAGGTVLIEDVCVPRSRLADMFAQIERIEAEFGVEIPTVAHAGDGNLHPNFIVTGAEIPEQVWAAADALFRAALALGGTLTGEHGVGTLKRRWLADELGEDVVDLQRAVKQAFDPLGILNPGKAV